MQLTEINSEMDIYCYSENLCEAKMKEIYCVFHRCLCLTLKLTAFAESLTVENFFHQFIVVALNLQSNKPIQYI